MSETGSRSEPTGKMEYDPQRRFKSPARKRKERSESVLQTGPATNGGDINDGLASNRLLAGYLAYEFLKSGTILGQKWDPTSRDGAGNEPRLKLLQNQQSYSDVATLVKDEEAHVTGVVNPTQLARWIQM